MSHAQHTPGQWQVMQPQNGDCTLCAGLYVQHVDGRPIAFASSGNRADAALLATSPELLELARDIVIARLDCLSVVAYHEAMDRIADRAHLLIAKAEGRA